MYICVCIYVYMYICICVYVYMCICVYVYMCICVYVYMYMYIPLLATVGDVFISLSNIAVQIFRMPPQRLPLLPWALHCLDLSNGSVSFVRKIWGKPEVLRVFLHGFTWFYFPIFLDFSWMQTMMQDVPAIVGTLADGCGQAQAMMSIAIKQCCYHHGWWGSIHCWNSRMAHGQCSCRIVDWSGDGSSAPRWSSFDFGKYTRAYTIDHNCIQQKHLRSVSQNHRLPKILTKARHICINDLCIQRRHSGFMAALNADCKRWVKSQNWKSGLGLWTRTICHFRQHDVTP